MPTLQNAAALEAKLQQIWIKAAEGGEPLVIRCNSEPLARKLRWTLYNTAAKVRRYEVGGRQVSTTLRTAVEEVEVSITGATVTLRRKAESPLAQFVAELPLAPGSPQVAGPVVDAGQSEEDRLIAESLAKLQAKLAEDAPKTVRSTPYYTRED